MSEMPSTDDNVQFNVSNNNIDNVPENMTSHSLSASQNITSNVHTLLNILTADKKYNGVAAVVSVSPSATAVEDMSIITSPETSPYKPVPSKQGKKQLFWHFHGFCTKTRSLQMNNIGS